MKRRRSIFAALVATAALAGCASSKPPAPAAAIATPATTPTIPMQASPTATPFTPPPDTGPFALGKSEDSVDGGATVTVYAYKQPTATGSPRPQTAGFVWGAIDARVCVHHNAIINEIPWTLVYSDDSQIESSNLGYNGFPSPGYPMGDKTLNNGRCIRGWIVFPVPKNKRPTMAEYSLDDGTELDWKI